jgi:NAD(P)-dependent dehydrogenase (short-subunit alcohol dehydrogenase family)
MSNSLLNRAAIVTGAASGIGAASARAFAAAGAKVLAVDLAPEGLAALAEEGLATLALDVAAPDAPERMVQEALARFSRLDIVFANAGVARHALAAETTDEAWDLQLAVNLTAPFRLARAAAPHVAKSPAGRILVTSSVMGEGTDYGLAAYCASKAGVLGLVRNLALEWGKHGVTVNAILPGAIATGMTRGVWDATPGTAEAWAKKAALRRLGQPEDIARVAAFLASDEAGFITGQAITVDGGLTLRV